MAPDVVLVDLVLKRVVPDAALVDPVPVVLAVAPDVALVVQIIADREGPSEALAQVALRAVDLADQKVAVRMDKHTIRCAWSIMRWSSMPIRMASLIGTNCSSSLGTCLAPAIKDPEAPAQVDPTMADLVTWVAVDPVAQRAVDPVARRAVDLVVVADLEVPMVHRRVVDHNDHSDLSNPQNG